MEKNATTSPGELPRRDFIKKTAAVAAAAAATPWLRAPVYGQNQAPSANVAGANNRIAVGIIGVGFGIGKDHLTGIVKNASANNVVLAAACEVYNQRRDWAKQQANLKDADVFADYKEMLDKRKDLDAILIATHDPIHAQASIDAMDAGKHVYCEKPLTRYLDEAFKVCDKVKSSGKVFQVGSQGCSAVGWQKCAELIQAGKIGTLVWAQGYYCRNSKEGEWNYAIEKDATEANIDWQKWLGPNIKKRNPFSAEEFHRWRKYYQYCAGLLGDLVPHRLHPLMLASGKPEFPSRVTCIGTHNVHSDLTVPGTPERAVAEHVQLLAEFPSGYMITITCSGVNAKSPGFTIYGHKATLEIGSSGERVMLTPEKPFADDIDPETLTGLQPEDIRVHEKNWFDSIRANKAPNANIDLAIRVQTVISLAEMSDRLKKTFLFDEKTRTITDADKKEYKPITYGTLELS
jgi:predicted dehydrogenase